jgi:hypothetical protein
MGKAKKKRAQKRQETRSKADPMGGRLIADERAKEADQFLHGLRSAEALTREASCGAVALVFNKPMDKKTKEKQLKLYQRTGVLKMLMDRLSDSNTDVSRTAAGALRNVCMAGGLDTCEYLVHEDAMTPLLSLLHKVSSRLKSKLVEQNAMQLASVIALISNLCESSGQAVMLLIDCGGAVQCVLECLQPGVLPDELVVAAAGLLHVVSDQNEHMATQLLTTEDAMKGFFQLVSTAQVPMLVRLHLAATLMNVHQLSNQLSASLQLIISPVVEALAFDVQAVLQQAAQAGSQAAALAEENKAKRVAEAKTREMAKAKGKGKAKKEGDADMSMETDSQGEANALAAGIKDGAAGQKFDDDEDDDEAGGEAIDGHWKTQVQPVILALEILTNLCVGVYDEDEEGEGEWEDVDDAGMEDGDGMAVGGEQAPEVSGAVQEVLALVSQSPALPQVVQLVGQFNFCVATVAADATAAGGGGAAAAAGAGAMSVPMHLRPTSFGRDTRQAHHRACCCLQNMVGNFPFEALNSVGGGVGGAGLVGLLSGLCDQAIQCKSAAHATRTQNFAADPSSLDDGAAAASAAGGGSSEDGGGAGGGSTEGDSGESVLSSLLSVLWAGLRRCLESCSDGSTQQLQGASLPLSAEHQQFISVLTSAEHCSCESTRRVAVGIVGTLGRFPPPYLPLGEATAAQRGHIGSVLLAACSDSSLVVITEALNAVYDVYADVEHNDVFAALGFVGHLDALAPQLSSKIAAESKSMDPDARAELKEARFNLKRFVEYKRSEARA